MSGGSGSAGVLGEAWAAFARGEWEVARAAFERALRSGSSGRALDGLGQTAFILGEEERAVELRARAFREYVREGEREAAASVAMFLAGMYRVYGNASLASGWLGRAERLLENCDDCAANGWLSIERSKRSASPEEAERHAWSAIELARAIDDAGLEACALSHAGLARVSAGELQEGLSLLEEAMTIATGIEAEDPLCIGDACCTTLVACERLADPRRARDWGEAITGFVRRRNYVQLWPWCRAVYAGFLIATGRWAEAERELDAALREAARIAAAGRDSAPRIRLAELRRRQGRLEEADRLLAGLEDRLDALEAVVALELERGELDLAAERVERRLESLAGERDALVAPLHFLHARVELARANTSGARRALEQGRVLATRAGRDDLLAAAEVLAARTARLGGHVADSAGLELAVERFADLAMPLEESEARIELARALAAERPRLAIAQARAALAGFERLGAARHSDDAAALLRDFGAPGRPAPRSAETLTRREQEVLALLGEGLSNPAIARRLVISPRTAEHHVRAVLRKLGLRNRAEAAAYAVRQGIGAGG